MSTKEEGSNANFARRISREIITWNNISNGSIPRKNLSSVICVLWLLVSNMIWKCMEERIKNHFLVRIATKRILPKEHFWIIRGNLLFLMASIDLHCPPFIYIDINFPSLSSIDLHSPSLVSIFFHCTPLVSIFLHWSSLTSIGLHFPPLISIFLVQVLTILTMKGNGGSIFLD